GSGANAIGPIAHGAAGAGAADDARAAGVGQRPACLRAADGCLAFTALAVGATGHWVNAGPTLERGSAAIRGRSAADALRPARLRHAAVGCVASTILDAAVGRIGAAILGVGSGVDRAVFGVAGRVRRAVFGVAGRIRRAVLGVAR